MLINKTKEAIEKYNMIQKGDTVCVGLSGGADSVALLLALSELKDEMGVTLEALHINHQLRGAESDSDERFCRDLCEKLNIPLYADSKDIRAFAAQCGRGIEEAARMWRYNVFNMWLTNKNMEHIGYEAGLAEKPEYGKGRICTAHTLNDSAETIIFNLCRGTGLKGLAGIPPVRDEYIIRPLIMCTREDVLKYLAEKGQDYVTDSTNLSDDYARNKIRHKVIPVLEEINAGFLGNIATCSEIILAEHEYMESEAEKRGDCDLRTVDRALRRRIIKQKLGKYLQSDVTAKTVKDVEALVMSGKRGRINVRGDYYAAAAGGRLAVCHRFDNKRKVFEPVLVKTGDNPFLCDRIVKISINSCEKSDQNENVHKSLTNNALDYDKIKGGVFLRNRRDGDKYIRAGRDFHSRLKTLFGEGVPLAQRDYMAILCDDDGIVWVEGFGSADRVKPCESTKKIMTVTVYKGDKYDG